jgi:hypothetical protein
MAVRPRDEGSFVSNHFTSPGHHPVDAGRLLAATSVGLAVISDAAVRGLTAGRFSVPAGVLLIGGASAHGPVDAQILAEADMLAALHGSLQAWRDRLPLDARDQYEACRVEARKRWTEKTDAALGPANGAQR